MQVKIVSVKSSGNSTVLYAAVNKDPLSSFSLSFSFPDEASNPAFTFFDCDRAAEPAMSE